ncbi:MAG: hypothetical protein ACRDLR_08215 [Gaiellaceae bacterium]
MELLMPPDRRDEQKLERLLAEYHRESR